MKAQTLNVEQAPAPIRTDTDHKSRDADEVSLISGGLFRLDARRTGGAVACLQGECWVTQEGDASDYHLSVGDIFQITHRGRVLVQGMARGARICVY
ncbi:MAG: DUF2917 domain-containing protein [Capsulimonas sp.]|uniref:DUF2917 domain-containing protein n=1 Tax=Capsulimonas sp. TaxID=2494211 RepID=UPI003267E02C